MEIYNDTYCVYVHTNKINGKVYVGQTIHGNRPHKRWDNGNGYKNCPLFWRAIQKYGWDGFYHDVIANNLTAEEADNFEILLINKLNSTDHKCGYNIGLGGTANKKLSEETKRKISESHMGEKNPMYGVRLIGEKNGMYGKKLSEEHKAKLRETSKKINLGKKMSEEQKKKISESRKGKYTGENSSFYGKHHTEEAKEKMSKAHKGANAFNAKAVVQLDDDYNLIKVWDCISDAWRGLNICRMSIPHVLSGKQKRAGGYRWMEKTEYFEKYGKDVM